MNLPFAFLLEDKQRECWKKKGGHIEFINVHKELQDVLVEFRVRKAKRRRKAGARRE